MTFPATSLDLKTELKLGSTWTDITGYTYVRKGVAITRGRRDEASLTDPSTLTIELDNRDGRFSMRNAVGAYYPNLGRNTPLRASLPDPQGTGMYVSATSGDRASTPDSAGLSITGDIDIRIDVSMDGWQPGCELVSKWAATGGQQSWQFYITSAGYLRLYWSTTGANYRQADSTVPVTPPASGRLALRVTLDVDNGAGGHAVTFYTSPTIGGTWTQLGAATTDSTATLSTTSIFDSTAPVEVGDCADGFPFSVAATGPLGKVFAVQVLSGIAGTAKANPDFTAQSTGTTSFADAAGNTWTLAGAAEISARLMWFYGEVASWPVAWDTSGKDVSTQITAAGVLRRLTQGSSPLNSTLFRGLTRSTTNKPVAYWPGEDGSGSSSLGSALGGPAMTISGSPELASYTGFACSQPIPTLNSSSWSGTVPYYTASPLDAQVRFLLSVPSTGATNNGLICRFITTGSCSNWCLFYLTGGALNLTGYDSTGTQLFTSGAFGFGLDGVPVYVGVHLQTSGSDVNWAVQTLVPGSSNALAISGTLVGKTIGRVTRVDINANANITDTAIGHISVQTTVTSLGDVGSQLKAYAGEAAAVRMRRLAAEEALPFWSIGGQNSSTAMGPQSPAKLADLMNECASTDGGMLYEPPGMLGLAYRTRESLYNQPANLTLAYNLGQVAPPFTPVDDDQQVRNDVSVARASVGGSTTGSTVRATLDSGALSTQAPPNGVGRYDTSVNANVATDDQVADQATWRLWLGTADEARYPAITVDRASSPISTNPTLDATVLAAGIGDRIAVTGMPSHMPPDAVSQLIQGITEDLGERTHKVTFNGQPESPYRVAVLDDTVLGHADTDGSSLHTSVNSSATSWSVDTTSGPIWTTAAGDFPFDIKIGGEVCTVTGITGSSSPQTFTVTRSVNGVSKSHSAGEDIRLAYPMILGL